MISHFYLLGVLIYFHFARGQDNLIAKIRDDIQVTISNPWRTFYASNAVDGNLSTSANACKCCAAATGSHSWLRLNLGRQYLIKTIIFIGRSDTFSNQSRGFSIYKGFSNSSGQQSLHNNTASSGYNFTIELTPHVALQYLELSRPNVLTICELELEDFECPSGLTGYPCEQCGYCEADDICDPTTGDCPNGCKPGYTGTSCQEQCVIGRFGKNCQSICHCHNDANCNHVNGSCPKDICAPGWKGLACNTECDSGTFGQNCWSTCHCLNNVTCDHKDGRCPNDECASGWKTSDCNTECDNRTFGLNCQNDCHCQDDVACEKASGGCPLDLCANGWKDSNCSTKCDEGTFGLNCSSVCHCQNIVFCDHENGTCPDNLCAPGWTGSDCNTDCDDGTFGEGCLSECHCRDQVACNKISGNCTSGLCANGWIGNNCSTECYEGTFGQNCSFVCHCQNNETCNHVNGDCPNNACAPGWKETDCNTECDDGTFGQNCESTCHCREPEICRKISGICLSGLCAKGWRGTRCNIGCLDGSFGQNCSSICHCFENVTCDHISGVCPDGSCASGWTGSDCNTASDNQRMDSSSTTGVITGTIVAAVVIAILAIAVIIYWRRKRNRTCAFLSPQSLPTSEKLRTEHKAEHEYTNTTVVYEKDSTIDETEHIYDGITPADDGLSIKHLWNVMKMAYDNGFAKLHEEFQTMHLNEIQRGQQPASVSTARKKDMKKIAHTERKIVLKEDGKCDPTLLDAQNVDGYGRQRSFIVTQGPACQTVNQFWEMVYQDNTQLIIMLEGTLERRKTLCVQYWPSEGKAVYGQVMVKKIKVTTYSDHIIRKFVISKHNTDQRQITQMQFTGWPDDSVPENAWQFVQFWRKSASVIEKENRPIFVHSCASTSMGSYIALDNLFKQAQTEGLIRPQDAIKELFKQSRDMIQTKEQYGFIHEALAEALYVRAKPIKQEEFEKILMSMSKQETESGKSGLAKQYDIMFQTDTTYTGLQRRASDHVYSDLTRKDCPQTSRNPPNTITLKNYAQQDAFILTTFDESVSEELWVLIETRKMKTIVRFETDKKNQVIGQRTDKGSQTKFSIQLLESKEDNKFIINSYAYKRKDSVKADVKCVKEFVYLGSKTDVLLSSDLQSLIAFICTIQQWQPAINENHPVLLCCRSDVQKTELCFPLLNEFDRIRSTGEVNLLETVVCMKEKDERLIPTFDQYEFFHTAVLEYIKNYEVYENV